MRSKIYEHHKKSIMRVSKKLTFPLLILVCAFTACAQNSHLDRFYQQYHDSGDNLGVDPGFLFSASFSGNGHIDFDGKSGDSGNSGKNDGNNDSKKDDTNWMHKITAIRCMIIDGKKTTGAASEWSDLSKALRADHFEEWFSVRKGTGRVQLLSRDKGETMEEIACLIVGDDNSGLFFHLRGHFTAADRARMESALQSHDSE